jgi:hypothetical protein
MIEIQVYHFSGVQASASAPPSAASNSLSAGSGGGGGGCFLATAGHLSHGGKQTILYTIAALCILIACFVFFQKIRQNCKRKHFPPSIT